MWQVNEEGYYGKFGGAYVPEMLYNNVENLKNKYFLNGSFRNDASSQLPPQNRNQNFWAVGAGWDLSRFRSTMRSRILSTAAIFSNTFRRRIIPRARKGCAIRSLN